MPQLDLIIVFPQIFWLLTIFFLTYTVIVHFFLPLFVKSLKVRQRIIAKNTEIVIFTQKKFEEKQSKLNTVVNKNFYLIKLLLETEINSILSKELLLDLKTLDTKVIEALYYNTLYYDLNILSSIPLRPKFSNLKSEN